jgi:hypothetical protein
MPARDQMSPPQAPKNLARIVVLYYCAFFTSTCALSDLANAFLGWDVAFASRPRLYVTSLLVTLVVIGPTLVRRWTTSGRAAGH